MEKPMAEQAQDWISAHIVMIEADDGPLCAVESKAYWELLGKPKKRHSDWWSRMVKDHKLLEGKDFFDLVAQKATKSTRGKPVKAIHYLPKTTALKLGAIANTDLGRAILDRLVNIADRVERGDPELIKEMIGKQTNPDVLADISDAAMRRAAKHWLDQGKPPEWVRQWVALRNQGIGSRIALTATLQEHGVKGGEFGRITDNTYQSLFGKSTNALREELDVPKGKTPRDRLALISLFELGLTEARSAEDIEAAKASGFSQCNRHVEDNAKRIAGSRTRRKK